MSERMRDSKPDARSKTTRPIRRQTLAAAVAERLRQQIINGELNEGAQLRPDALAEQFAVSRLPVREALLRLEAEGLINVMANRGAVVSALSPEEIGELFEIRAVLECHILREAVPRLTAERLLDAERILNEYEQAVEEEWDLSSWEELNWRFHSSLYAAAGRPMLMSLLKLLNNNCGRYTRLHLLVTRRLHWAGTETATRWSGYIDGAISSGVRAAEEVARAAR